MASEASDGRGYCVFVVGRRSSSSKRTSQHAARAASSVVSPPRPGPRSPTKAVLLSPLCDSDSDDANDAGSLAGAQTAVASLTLPPPPLSDFFHVVSGSGSSAHVSPRRHASPPRFQLAPARDAAVSPQRAPVLVLARALPLASPEAKRPSGAREYPPVLSPPSPRRQISGSRPALDPATRVLEARAAAATAAAAAASARAAELDRAYRRVLSASRVRVSAEAAAPPPPAQPWSSPRPLSPSSCRAASLLSLARGLVTVDSEKHSESLPTSSAVRSPVLAETLAWIAQRGRSFSPERLPRAPAVVVSPLPVAAAGPTAPRARTPAPRAAVSPSPPDARQRQRDALPAALAEAAEATTAAARRFRAADSDASASAALAAAALAEAALLRWQTPRRLLAPPADAPLAASSAASSDGASLGPSVSGAVESGRSNSLATPTSRGRDEFDASFSGGVRGVGWAAA